MTTDQTPYAGIDSRTLDAVDGVDKHGSIRPSAEPAGQQEVTPKWQRITKPGQVKVGDKLRFTIGDSKYSETAKRILNAGKCDEEIIYNKRRNYYLITSMAIANKGSSKNCEFLAIAATAEQLSTPGAARQGGDTCAEMRALCSACGGTGDVHGLDGEWRGACDCEASAWSRAAPPAHEGVDTATDQFTRFMDALIWCAIENYVNGGDTETVQQARIAKGNFIAHIDGLLAQQREAGRRDAHETNMTLLNDICKLSEKLEKAKAALATRQPVSALTDEQIGKIIAYQADVNGFNTTTPEGVDMLIHAVARALLAASPKAEPVSDDKRDADRKAARWDFLRGNWSCNYDRQDKTYSFFYDNRGELCGDAKSYNDIPDLESIIDRQIAPQPTPTKEATK